MIRGGMRLVVVLTTLLLLAAVARADELPEPQIPVDVLVVGDSLAVGMRPSLPDDIAPRTVWWDARTGRTTPEQLKTLKLLVQAHTPRVVVISLGTNDGSDPSRFSARVRRTLQVVGDDACVVWPDISRPERKGAFAGLNRALHRAALHRAGLTIVPWRDAVVRREVRMRDGVHPTRSGYRHRSLMVARAIRDTCPS